jgi:hypothetical protein
VNNNLKATAPGPACSPQAGEALVSRGEAEPRWLPAPHLPKTRYRQGKKQKAAEKTRITGALMPDRAM